MTKNSMSLKSRINNIAKDKNVSPQSIMQIYMLERLLERISISKYKDNFVLKGGMLISSFIGIDNRSTMDMDTTIKNYPLELNKIEMMIKDIINIDLEDNIEFRILSIENIREDDDYGGYRVNLVACYEKLAVNLKIDITTGDKITFKEINYEYKLLLEDRYINIWSYNIETIIAEKYESIIKRSILNTRIRDFYDIYMLMSFKRVNNKMLVKAIKETSKHRNSFDIVDNIELVDEIIADINNNDVLMRQWDKYKSEYYYAKDIEYESVIANIKQIRNIYFEHIDKFNKKTLEAIEEAKQIIKEPNKYKSYNNINEMLED